MRRSLILSCALLFVPASLVNAAELKFNTQDFAPFSYEINGAVAGPAVEIIAKVCAKMDAKCTFALLPWKRAQQKVEQGSVQGMFVIGWNESRSKWVHFSPPILKTEYGFFVNSSSSLSYKALKDVEGQTVSVYGPSNTSKSLERIREKMKKAGLTPIKIDMRPDDEAGFKKLALNRVDAVFSNRDVGFALAAKLGLTQKVRYAGQTRSLNYYIGFNAAKNNQKVLDRFNGAFNELTKAGEIQRILDKYNMLPADPKLVPANFNKR